MNRTNNFLVVLFLALIISGVPTPVAAQSVMPSATVLSHTSASVSGALEKLSTTEKAQLYQRINQKEDTRRNTDEQALHAALVGQKHTWFLVHNRGWVLTMFVFLGLVGVTFRQSAPK